MLPVLTSHKPLPSHSFGLAAKLTQPNSEFLVLPGIICSEHKHDWAYVFSANAGNRM